MIPLHLFIYLQDTQELILVDANFRLPETKRLRDLTAMSSSAVGLFVLFEKLAKNFQILPAAYIDDKKVLELQCPHLCPQNTPLHFLVQNEKIEYVERLLNLVDTKTKPVRLTKNADNASALTLAIQKGNNINYIFLPFPGNKRLVEILLNYLLKVPAAYRGEISANIYLLAKKFPGSSPF